MNDDDNLKENIDNSNSNIETDLDLAKLKEQLKKSFDSYQQTMKYMLGDAPIQTLCLNARTEAILLDSGFLRIYDIFNADLIKVKGLGVVRIKELTTRLDQFFAMLG